MAPVSPSRDGAPGAGPAEGDDDDSDATHDSMPELIPVESAPAPPVLLRRAGRLQPTSVRQLLGFPGLAALRGRKRPLDQVAAAPGADSPAPAPSKAEAGEAPGDDAQAPTLGKEAAEVAQLTAAGADCEASTASKEAAEADEAAALPFVPRVPTDVAGRTASAGYGQRADALAAVLDRLDTPSSSGPAPCGEEAACGGGAADEDGVLEISAAAERRAEAGAKDLLDVGMLDESDSEEVDGDDGAECAAASAEGTTKEASARASKRRALRRRREHLQVECPPGAPAVAPASSSVVDAAAAVAGPGQCAASETPAEGSSFGPRFRDISTNELQEVRSRWTMHSLAEVPRTSSQDNQRVAAAFVEDLRRRRETARAPAVSPPPPEGKPVFKRPAPRSLGAEASAAGARHVVEVKPGVFLADECVVGAGRRRPPLGAAAAAQEEEGEEDGGQAAKRRRVQRGGVCAALSEAAIGDDQEDVDPTEPLAPGAALASAKRRRRMLPE